MNLTNRLELISYLKAYGLWLKKESGQHFLIDQAVLNQLVQAAELKPDDCVLEIGPGVGTLTQVLAQTVPDGLVLAVEKDFKLVSVLREEFKNKKNVKIVHENALRFLQEIEKTEDRRQKTDWKLVANLPYNITGQILRFLFDPNLLSPISTSPTGRFNFLVLMLQKEVVERLLAPPGISKRGLLTLLRELFGPAELIVNVPKTAFFPAPAVNSAVIRITRHISDTTYISPNTLDKCIEECVHVSPEDAVKIVWLAKLGFAAKRRTLENALHGGLHQQKSIIAGWLQTAAITPNSRAEDLDLSAWQRLVQVIEKDSKL